MAINMGIGQLGFENNKFKRKFRYTFELSGSHVIPQHFVKICARPSISIESTEIHFLNAKTYLPGKATLEPMSVTYIDVAHNEMQPLYNWLASVYDFAHPTTLYQGSSLTDYECTGELLLLDGCGTPLERWEMKHVWPESIDFGDLDYSSSEECTIQLSLRYSELSYMSLCPVFEPESTCSGCGSGIVLSSGPSIPPTIAPPIQTSPGAFPF